MTFDLEQIRQGADWTLAGVCDPNVPDAWKNQYDAWLQDFKGPQMKYLEKRKDEKLDPTKLLPSVQSIFCFGLYYYPGDAIGEVKISNYSWGEDYHLVLKRKLEKTVSLLQNEFGSFDYRLGVDTSPLLEKKWAEKAGLGWQGKNTLLIHPQKGSYLFLGEILTSLPVDYFTVGLPVTDHCGTCTRCIEACPTDALQPYVLDATKCISYWTLEHKGEFTEETPDFHSWIAGCDICQQVCPWNRKAEPLQDASNTDLSRLRLSDVESPTWLEKIQGRAVDYIPKANWTRNLDHIQNSSS